MSEVRRLPSFSDLLAIPSPKSASRTLPTFLERTKLLKKELSSEAVVTGTNDSFYFLPPGSILARIAFPGTFIPPSSSSSSVLGERISNIFPSIQETAEITKTKIDVILPAKKTGAVAALILSGKTYDVDHALQVLSWLFDIALAAWKDASVLRQLVSQKAIRIHLEHYVQSAWTPVALQSLPPIAEMSSSYCPQFTPRSTKVSKETSLAEPARTSELTQRTLDGFPDLIRDFDVLERDMEIKGREDDSKEPPSEESDDSVERYSRDSRDSQTLLTKRSRLSPKPSMPKPSKSRGKRQRNR